MIGYLLIADHGLIGDLHSVALVGTNGTIDWYCCPNFDSPSVFGSILDARRGGCYCLAPTGRSWTSKQLYFPDTAVLITRFLTPDGVGEVEDFMPVAQGIGGGHRQRVVRRLLAVRGQVGFELDCSPRFDYGRAEHAVERHEHGVLFRSPDCTLSLATETPLQIVDGAARASFSLSQGESATFVLEHVVGDDDPRGHSVAQTRELADQTVAYWRRWLSQSRYTGRWREMVHRSGAHTGRAAR
ncbi:MAG TPA: trehalase-like domain-containing protein [Solirubrobacteraceae bacterium]